MCKNTIIESLLTTGKYSDLTIICQGKEFKVHRAIVCLQSKPLAAAVDGNFKEAITSTIDLSSNEPEIVKNMLKFMYSGDYSDNGEPEDMSTPTSIDTYTAPVLLTNAQVFVIAELYDVQPLKQLAAKKYQDFVTSGAWINSDFIASFKCIYYETPESEHAFRDIAMRTVTDNLAEFINEEEFETLCKENGHLGFDIIWRFCYP